MGHNCGTGRAPGVVLPGRRRSLAEPHWLATLVVPGALFCGGRLPQFCPIGIVLVAASRGSVSALIVALARAFW